MELKEIELPKIVLVKDINGGYTSFFFDYPYIISEGADKKSAIENLMGCLESAIIDQKNIIDIT